MIYDVAVIPTILLKALIDLASQSYHRDYREGYAWTATALYSARAIYADTLVRNASSTEGDNDHIPLINTEENVIFFPVTPNGRSYSHGRNQCK